MRLKSLPLIIILIFFGFFYNSYAGNTGKISGKVTDSNSGEALIGINIILEGTTLGAASDINGKYVINNIEPGVYTLIVSGIGYQKKKITAVNVASDYTTEIDIRMSEEAVGLETIVVQAKEPLIRKDLTSSKTVIDNSKIESLPVESLDQILSLQAGIVKGSGGELHIRGGRSTEISYNVNGLSAVNPFDYGRTVQISTNAVQELSVVSGTFNAEYGNALSGVVNTITKEGGKKYTGSISFYTGDYISSSTNVFNNIDDINPLSNKVVEGTFGGPIPLLEDNLSFFVSARYDDSEGYLYGIRQHTIYDSLSRDQNDPNKLYLAQTGDNKIVSMNPSEDINFTGKLTFKPISTIKINYDVVYSSSNYQTYSHDYKYNPDANYNRYTWGLVNSLEYKHAVSDNTFFELKGSYSIYDFKRYLFPLLDASGNEVSFNPSMSLSGLQADPRYQPYDKSTSYSPFTFVSGGTRPEHFYQRSNTAEVKFDLTSQLHSQHELKFGFNAKWDKLNYVYFQILRDRTKHLIPEIPNPATDISSIDIYSRKPVQYSGYIQDKMEFESMIINAGLRFDYFNSKSIFAPDDFSPTSDLEDAESKLSISPRLGMSFPITEQGIIHFSYGHFYQLPPYRYLYTNPNFEDISAAPTYGNANLNPEKTITYEIGLQQQLSEDVAFNVTGFYKDVRDLLAIQQIRISSNQYYNKYVNKDYGNIKGITFSLSKRKLNESLFGASLDYTFQVAEGNETGADAFFIDLLSGRQSEKIPVPLAWDQRHTLNGVLTFGEADNWTASLVASIGSGLPYTPVLYEQQIYLRTNSDLKPLQTNVDILLDKSFTFGTTIITLFMKVFNLFDTKNERYVYNDTGRATYSLEQQKGGPEATNKVSEIYPGIKSATEYFNRPHYYTSPREVRFGVSLKL